jgi:hypothetical protein
MAQGKHKTRPGMPAAARVIAGAIGLCPIIGSAGMFLMVRPLSWGVVWVGVGAAGLGVDFLSGGIRGRWPVSIEAWLDMAR